MKVDLRQDKAMMIILGMIIVLLTIVVVSTRVNAYTYTNSTTPADCSDVEELYDGIEITEKEECWRFRVYCYYFNLSITDCLYVMDNIATNNTAAYINDSVINHIYGNTSVDLSNYVTLREHIELKDDIAKEIEELNERMGSGFENKYLTKESYNLDQENKQLRLKQELSAELKTEIVDDDLLARQVEVTVQKYSQEGLVVTEEIDEEKLQKAIDEIMEDYAKKEYVLQTINTNAITGAATKNNDNNGISGTTLLIIIVLLGGMTAIGVWINKGRKNNKGLDAAAVLLQSKQEEQARQNNKVRHDNEAAILAKGREQAYREIEEAAKNEEGVKPPIPPNRPIGNG